MTILSDGEIRDLCIPPELVLDLAKYNAFMAAGRKIPRTAREQEDWYHEIRVAHSAAPTLEERTAWRSMISPFVGENVREVEVPGQGSRKILSYGLSSYGYDVRLAEEFKIFTNVNSSIVDPKQLDSKCLVDAAVNTDVDGSRYVILPPNSYLLGRTVEQFHIPRDIMVICLGKSTLARCGGIVNVTPIEPGFEGVVVIEISNATNLPLKIYANEGISQFLFFRGNVPCHTSYGDRAGKYQGQRGVQLPKV